MASKLKGLRGRITCRREEVNLGITLHGGQSFRWTTIEENDGTKYRGVFRNEVWTLSQDDSSIYFIAHNETYRTVSDSQKIVENYLNLDINLAENIKKWMKCDKHFEKFVAADGVRILDQDVVENVFSFICSANNNIKRIKGMIERMCQFYGRELCQVDDKIYYDFPTIESLSKESVLDKLKTEGFGYRAKYINQTAIKLMELGGREWLNQLMKKNGCDYDVARKEIQLLSGVGPKVADCICLMSLGHLEAIPVDTHIFQVAKSVYLPELKNVKNVSSLIYDRINKHFIELWGPLAGWAQTIVFCTRINIDTTKRKTNNENLDENTSKMIKIVYKK